MLWDTIPVIVIGSHNGQVFRETAREAAFIPLDFYEPMMRGLAYYTTFSFTIGTEHNREVERVREEFLEIVSRPEAGLIHLQLIMSTHDLHTMVGIARQTLLLLELVYPLAVGASLVIAFGLSLLLMLQTAKNAAILRVLGAQKGKAMSMLLVEQVLVSLAGAALGLIALAALSAAFDRQFAIVLALYLGGVLSGAALGAVIICNRTPLRMLQVKE